jgi:hypothetical protein
VVGEIDRSAATFRPRSGSHVFGDLCTQLPTGPRETVALNGSFERRETPSL